MNIEIRITNKDQMNEIKNLPFEVVGIGDEYCPHKLCDTKELLEIIDICEKYNKKFCIVTSFLSNSSFETTIETLKQVFSKNKKVDIVINDYGLLKRLLELGYKDNFSAILGQMIVYSVEEYLWVDEIIENENEFIKENWLINGFANKKVIDYFKKQCDFKSVILNYLPFGMRSAEEIKKEDISVSFLDKYYSMAVARKCHVARYHNVTPSKRCSQLCDREYKIDIVKTYNTAPTYPKDKFAEPSDVVKDKVRDWVIWGNGIYREYENVLDKEKFKNDNIILNYRYYNDINELENRIEYYRI